MSSPYILFQTLTTKKIISHYGFLFSFKTEKVANWRTIFTTSIIENRCTLFELKKKNVINMFLARLHTSIFYVHRHAERIKFQTKLYVTLKLSMLNYNDVVKLTTFSNYCRCILSFNEHTSTCNNLKVWHWPGFFNIKIYNSIIFFKLLNMFNINFFIIFPNVIQFFLCYLLITNWFMLLKSLLNSAKILTVLYLFE